MARISLKVNGQRHQLDIDPLTPLVWVLRDHLGLTGTKYSCGISECGACTVLVDGESTRSCDFPVSQLGRAEVTTIEGLGLQQLHPLQEAWLSEEVSQCGYCQPGQMLTAAALLASNPHPTAEEISEEMSGVICRCGTYHRIKKAVGLVAGLEESHD